MLMLASYPFRVIYGMNSLISLMRQQEAHQENHQTLVCYAASKWLSTKFDYHTLPASISLPLHRIRINVNGIICLDGVQIQNENQMDSFSI